jgi:hypothetical protein
MTLNDSLIPLEENEQMAFVQYLELRNIKFTAIPNSTFTKSRRQKRKNHDMGLRPGLPDLVLILGNRLVFIEMKREKVGKVSVDQKEWIEAINNCQNGEAYVCYGYEEAKKLVEGILKK